MPLKPPMGARAPERILGYGGPGVGKSSCWLDIAQKMYETKTEGRFYVIDTDRAVNAAFGEGYGHLESMVEVFECYTWEDLKNAQKKITEINPGSKDWVVLDLLSMPYTEVRRHYTQLVYGQDLDEYIIETAQLIREARERARAEKKSGGHEREFGDWSGKDWDHMGKIYLDWELPLTLRCNANVFACAEERQLSDQRGAKPDQIKRYKDAGGFKPYVNNTAEHRFRTVVRVTNPGSNRELRLAKDRYRQKAWDEESTRGTVVLGDMNGDGGFTRKYLVDIAGWRLRKART